MKYIRTYEGVWDWFKPTHAKELDFESQLKKIFVEINKYKEESRMKVYKARQRKQLHL
jgi:hypothetical protein